MSAVKYAVVTNDARVYPKKDLLASDVNLEAGSMIQIIGEHKESPYMKFIKIYMFEGRNTFASEELYVISENYEIVEETLWNMLFAFKNKYKRIRIIRNLSFRYFLLTLKIGDEVNVGGTGKLFVRENVTIPCIIQYIGPVKEIGPGTFFGFNIKNGKDKPRRKTFLAERYFNCKPENGFIVPADVLLYTKPIDDFGFTPETSIKLVDGVKFVSKEIEPTPVSQNKPRFQRTEKKANAKELPWRSQSKSNLAKGDVLSWSISDLCASLDIKQ